jgi:hypothetical protein
VDVFPSNVPLLGHSSYVHACGYAKSSHYDLPSNNQMEMAQFPKLQSMKITVKQQEVGQSRRVFGINLYNLLPPFSINVFLSSHVQSFKPKD